MAALGGDRGGRGTPGSALPSAEGADGTWKRASAGVRLQSSSKENSSPELETPHWAAASPTATTIQPGGLLGGRGGSDPRHHDIRGSAVTGVLHSTSRPPQAGGSPPRPRSHEMHLMFSQSSTHRQAPSSNPEVPERCSPSPHHPTSPEPPGCSWWWDSPSRWRYCLAPT